jgi:hypothetical protein
LRDEAIDGGFKVVDGSEDAAHRAGRGAARPDRAAVSPAIHLQGGHKP